MSICRRASERTPLECLLEIVAALKPGDISKANAEFVLAAVRVATSPERLRGNGYTLEGHLIEATDEMRIVDLERLARMAQHLARKR